MFHGWARKLTYQDHLLLDMVRFGRIVGNKIVSLFTTYVFPMPVMDMQEFSKTRGEARLAGY